MNKRVGDKYVYSLRLDRKIVKQRNEYFQGLKSSQQYYLESLIEKDYFTFIEVADVACGGGALSFWLNEKYPQCHYTLIDLNPEALEDAKNVCVGNNFTFKVGNIYDLKEIVDNSFDLTCCWQTLSWLENPELALHELIRITRHNGRIYLSSLFNDFHEVDVYSKVFDWTRESTNRGNYVVYNTYCLRTIQKWIGNLVRHIEFYKFDIDVDLLEKKKGLGTYTIMTVDGKRLQVSGGILLNWGILKIIK